MKKCITQHEEIHMADALKANPNVCVGKADNVPVGAQGDKESSATENKAWSATIKCAQKELKNCKKCKKDAIDELKAFLVHEGAPLTAKACK
jgi:hypothetical protein